MDGFQLVLDKMRISILFIIIASIFWQCSETKEVDPEDLGTNYYPLKTGTYKIYQVNSTEYVSSGDSIVLSYLLKESVVDSFQNLESGISYKIQRQKKYSENDTWRIDSIWTSRKNERTAVLVENNVPMVNLTFPIKENMMWDGNKLNDKNVDEFEMIDVREPYQDSSGSYERTVTVVQEDFPDTFVQSVLKKEIYAEDIGLAYKEIIILNYKQGEFFGKELIDTGLRYFQHLVEYGEE